MSLLGERVQREKRKRLRRKPSGVATFKVHIEDGNPANSSKKE